MTKSIKTRKVRIRVEEEETISEIIYFFHESHDLFPSKFLELKGIVGDLGFMRISLNPSVKPAK